MKAIEIRDLVVGILAVVLMAIALGQYERLEKFARTELAKALRPKPTPQFFLESHDVR